MNNRLQEVTYLLFRRLARLEAFTEMNAPQIVIDQEKRLVQEALDQLKELTK